MYKEIMAYIIIFLLVKLICSMFNVKDDFKEE